MRDITVFGYDATCRKTLFHVPIRTNTSVMQVVSISSLPSPIGTNTRLVADMFKAPLEAGFTNVRETGNAKEFCRAIAKKAAMRLLAADGNIRAIEDEKIVYTRRPQIV